MKHAISPGKNLLSMADNACGEQPHQRKKIREEHSSLILTQESAAWLNRKKLLSIVFLNQMRLEMDGRCMVRHGVTLQASFLAFPVFLYTTRID
jgi:hypothetical protein